MSVTEFGNLILIKIDIYDFISPFSRQFQCRLRRYIKHSRQYLTNFQVRSSKVSNLEVRLGVWEYGQTRSFVFDILHQNSLGLVRPRVSKVSARQDSTNHLQANKLLPFIAYMCFFRDQSLNLYNSEQTIVGVIYQERAFLQQFCW